VKVKSNSNMAMNNNNKQQCENSKPPPLSFHHSKINQRQDSNISSDSYSMMSSPGYNSKTMETPLLKNTSRMKKSKNFNYQNNADSFNMSNMNGNIQRGGCDVNSKRQDSSLSSESISQTSSSSGFNSNSCIKATDLHALKMQTCELSIYICIIFV
jgi:atrial natriuretic peptide-converting enzyme